MVGKFRILIVAAALVVLWSISTSRAPAQITYDGCYLGQGYPIPSVPSPGINDIAFATIYNGSPVILYNPMAVALVSPRMRTFMYYHECAHHVRGHTLGTVHPMYMEQDADCWAIINLVRSGQFGGSDVQALQQELSVLGRGDWTHLPGPQRAINLYECLRGG